MCVFLHYYQISFKTSKYLRTNTHTLKSKGDPEYRKIQEETQSIIKSQKVELYLPLPKNLTVDNTEHPLFSIYIKFRSV